MPEMNDVDIANLDAYDQGRIDTNERFIEILKKGVGETRTREELIDFIVRQIDTMRSEKESCRDCD